MHKGALDGCMPTSRLGLSAPFFKSGWGDLGVVSFEEAESLLKGWPPEHFDTKVTAAATLQSPVHVTCS